MQRLGSPVIQAMLKRLEAERLAEQDQSRREGVVAQQQTARPLGAKAAGQN